MKTTDKIHLTEEKETLFITLYAKALDSRSKHSILHDTTADNLLNTIDYDFTKHKNFFNDNMTVVRAKQYDDWIAEFIEANTYATILHLGCGLDTRIFRLNPSGDIAWFDVDYPEVIKLRRTFFPERKDYQMIESD